MSEVESTDFAGCELVCDPERLCRFQYSGLSERPTPLRGIVFPRTSEDVSRILREASRRAIPVYPISQGRNWGYGSASPVTPGCLVLSLAHLNRILQIDAQLATAEIEAGVTQGQLYEALQGTDLLADANGAGPQASIVGNILERGFGHTPLGLRTQHFQATEFVLGSGEIVRPAGAGAHAHAERMGLGAGLHELLTQNNLAVVTRMRVHLMRRPQRSYRCILQLRDPQRLGAYIDAMRSLKEEGIFDGLPHIANDYRLLTMVERFAFAKWDPARGVPAADRRALTQRHGIAAWTLAAGIYGTRSTGPAKVRRARQQLSALGDLRILRQDWVHAVGSAILQHAPRLPRLLREPLRRRVDILEHRLAILRIMDGEPSAVALRGCYWRNRRPAPEAAGDPVQDGCGFRWLAPVLPLLRAPLEEFIALGERRYQEHGFEFVCTLTAISSRACTAILTIYFDRDAPQECERALALAALLKREFDQRGWPSYRLAIDQMQEELAAAPPELVALRSRIKHAFDPGAVIAPGRYAPVQVAVAGTCAPHGHS